MTVLDALCGHVPGRERGSGDGVTESHGVEG